MKIFVKTLLFFCLLGVTSKNFAQDIPSDLTKIKSYQITDNQLKKYIAQAGASGLSQTEVEAELKKRGLPDSEIVIIRERIRLINSANTKTAEGSIQNNLSRENSDSVNLMKNPGLPTGKTPSSKLFGADLFSTSNISFEPNLKIPTPPNYILGPNDMLNITFSGVNDAQQSVSINLEGNVNLKYIGPTSVNGLSVEEAKKRIFTMYSKIYPSLKSGKTQMQISLGNIRSIKVTILGSSLKAGTYTLPSLATVYNALYASGGPDDYGSFREIELIRRNKIIQKIDIYNYLLYGDQSQDMRLEDRDVIRIPMAKKRVLINGEIKTEGIFEILPGEKFNKLLQFAGGFRRSAYTALIKVERITEREKKLIDVTKSNFEEFLPEDGDTYTVGKILDRFENAVTILGAVFRPGNYSLVEGMRLKDLIDKAEGLKEDVYKKRALLYRLRDDQSKEMTSINLDDLYAGKVNNILLRKDDKLVISSLLDLLDEGAVSIGGSVRKPALYPFSDSMTLKDLIVIANGLTEEAFTGRAIITRVRIDGTSLTISVALDSIINGTKPDIILEKRDFVHISSISDLTNKAQISIFGAIKIPGSIQFSDSLTLKNLILRRGGFTEDASANNIEVARRRFVDPNNPKSLLSDIMKTPLDTIELSINNSDYYLKPYDIVTVKFDPFKKPQQLVNVEGQVLFPGPYALSQREERLSNLIDRAGGVLLEGNLKGIKLRRPRKIHLDVELISKMSLQTKDSSGTIVKDVTKDYEDIAIDGYDALKNRGGRADVILKDGDLITVPLNDDMVSINGEVLHPVKISYKSRNLKSYIGSAGGFVTSANKKRVFVVYANGRAARTKNVFMIFRKYPKVEPGTSIFVPRYDIEIRAKKSPAEIVATVSAVSTAAYLLIFISQQLK